MTYDLPPLPYPQMPGNDYTAEDMRRYAIAAIERHKARTPDALREAAKRALALIDDAEAEPVWHAYELKVSRARDALRAALEGDQ